MEKEIQINTPDNKTIYGVLTGSIKRPLVVIVHGLCGHMNEALHYNAAHFFEKAGYSSFRFGLYSYHKGARKLHQCTLKTHGKDIDTVLKFLKREGARKIYLVGHSYGFPSILNSNTKNVKAIASWDGSYLPHTWLDKMPKIAKPKGRIIDEGYWTIIGEPMVKEARTMNSDKMIAKVSVPVKFITIPSKTQGNLIGSKKMYAVLSAPKDLIVISGAGHNFNEEGKQAELYKETVKWFKKYL